VGVGGKTRGGVSGTERAVEGRDILKCTNTQVQRKRVTKEGSWRNTVPTPQEKRNVGGGRGLHPRRLRDKGSDHQPEGPSSKTEPTEKTVTFPEQRATPKKW